MIISCLKEFINGDLWIGFSSSYVNKFSNEKFFAYDIKDGLTGKKINSIIDGPSGNLLFASQEKGIFIYKKNKFIKHKVVGLKDSDQIISLFKDSEEKLWIGTTEGLIEIDNKSYKKYSTIDGISNNYITSIAEDSDKNLWIGTLKGLNRLQKDMNGNINIEYICESSTIMSIFEDMEKNLWVGTSDSGLRRLRDRKFTSFIPPNDYQHCTFSSLYMDRMGDIWIGTACGKVLHFNNNQLIESIVPPLASKSGIVSMTEDNEGNLWLGTIGKGAFVRLKSPHNKASFLNKYNQNRTYKGFSKCSKKSKKRSDTFLKFSSQDGICDNTITSIYQDSGKNIWFCTIDGVSKLSSSHCQIKSIKDSTGLSGKRAFNIFEDKNKNIWIAANRGVTVLKNGHIKESSASYYLKGISISCIIEELNYQKREEEVFWISTHGSGLIRLNKSKRRITSFTTSNGMYTNFLYQMIEHHNGEFWILSDNGILRLKKSELIRIANGEKLILNCISYGITDGLNSLEFVNKFSVNSVLKKYDNEFWINTSKGISIYNPSKFKLNELSVPTLIEDVYVDTQCISVSKQDRTFSFRGEKKIGFHFRALSLLPVENIRFKYMLDGYDKNWRILQPLDKPFVYYENLNTGSYLFKVIACNSHGIWSNTGDSFNFIIKSGIGKNLILKVFILLILILSGVKSIQFLKNHFRQKDEEKRELNLNGVFAEECVHKLNYLMNVEKVYCDENISLKTLAEMISIPSYQLSHLINKKMNRNFTEYINIHRIEEAKRIMDSKNGVAMKNSVIAFEVGFNTMSVFYRAFRKYTNITPSEYKKMVRDKYL